MDHQFDSTRYLKNINNKTDYMIVIFAANKGEGSWQTSWNDTGPVQPHKEAPHIYKMEHIELYNVPMSPWQQGENRIVPEAFVL